MGNQSIWSKCVVLALALCISGGLSPVAAKAAKAAPKTGYKYVKPIKSTQLPRVAPESKGISSLYLLNMVNEFEKRDIELHSLMVAVDGDVIFEGYYNPYNPDDPYIIHSLTKVFTNTAAGIAFTEGKLKFTDKVVDFFPDIVPKDANENLKAMTMFDLITMRSGHDREISGNEWRPLKTSWLEAFMKEPVPHKPGVKYKYSSGNSYVLSAMVQKATGMTCEALIKDRLVKKLGMAQFSWQKSPEGICSGGTGVNSRAIRSLVQETVLTPTLADAERKYDGKYAKALKTKGELLNVLPLATVFASPVAEKINGKTFAIAENPDGIKEITLTFTDKSVTYTMKDARGTHSVVNGIGSWIAGATSMTGNYLHHQYQNESQKVVASAQWRDDNTLTMIWTYPEMAFRDFLTIKLTDKDISMVRSVNVNSKGKFGGLVRPEVTGKTR